MTFPTLTDFASVPLTARQQLDHRGSVPIGSVALYLVLAVLTWAQGPLRGITWGRWVAPLVLVALALMVGVRGGIDINRLWNDPPLFDLVAALTGLMLAVDLIGLPLPLARRLRLGLHSREWEFDRRLSALANEARRTADRAADDPGLPARELPRIIARMSALRPPDDDWAALRDGWAAAWQRYLNDLATGPTDASSAEALVHHRELMDQTELLRDRYRSEASRILGKGS